MDQEWTEDLGQTADSGVGLEKSEDRDPEPGRTRGEPGRTREPGRTADSDLDPARTTRGLDPGRTTSGLDPRQTADPGRTVVRDLDPGRTVDCGDCGVSVNQVPPLMLSIN